MLKIFKRQASRLERVLTELENDLEAQSTGQKIYYACDFSELYAFLNLTDENVDPITVGFGRDDAERAKHINRLSLYHLFTSFTDRLFILPSHTLELWSYTRRETLNNNHFGFGERVKEIVQKFTPAETEFLTGLEGQVELSEDDRKRLTEIVKEDFEEICTGATDYLRWKKKANSLKYLLSAGKLSLEVTPLLDELGVDAVARQELEPRPDEENRVMAIFGAEFPHYHKLTKRRDASALLFLRNINRLLSSSGRRLVLISRDDSIKQVADIMEKIDSLNSAALPSLTRRPETVFFDLILRGIHSDGDKIKWLQRSRKELRRVRVNLSSLDGSIHESSPPNWGPDDDDAFLQDIEGEVLSNIFKTWYERINLQLSTATGHLEWTEDLEHFAASEFEADTEAFAAITPIRHLLEFVRSEQYESIAIAESQRVWNELTTDALRIRFLSYLRSGRLGEIGQVIPTKILDSKGLFLLPPSYTLLPYLRFTSLRYVKTSEEFSSCTLDTAPAPREIYPLFATATNGIGEPDDFLFMAFILCILQTWEAALEITGYILELYDQSEFAKANLDMSQLLYFRAFIQRKLSHSNGDFRMALGLHEVARTDIETAIQIKNDDPRYLNEHGSIFLSFFWIQRKLDRLPPSESQRLATRDRGHWSLENARVSLKRALSLQLRRNRLRAHDIQLRLEILINLLYLEAIISDTNIMDGAGHLSRIKKELSQPEAQFGFVFDELRLHFEIANIIFQAKQYLLAKNLQGLRNTIELLRELEKRTPFSTYHADMNREHILLLEMWASEVEHADAFPISK